MAHVVGEVELRVVDPDGAPLVEGDEAQALAEARDEMQARGDVLAEVVVVRGRTLEDQGGGDVHVGRARLQMEKRGVKAGQAVS